MNLHLELIQSKAQLGELVNTIKREKVLAVDTEFIREKTFFPKLALIQVGTKTDTWLIDNLAFNKEGLQPLLTLLTDKNILKIFHSAYGDQECFYSAYHLTATPTLDTYECASLLGYGESVSLRDLIWKNLNIKIPKHLTRTDWLRRPVSEEMKKYAMTDVQYLVTIAENLLQELENKNRKEWAFQLSKYYEKHSLYENNSKDISRRLAKSGKINSKSYPLLMDLVDWREKRAQDLDIPRRRIADDETLINLANSRPSSLIQLEKFRGLNSGEVRRQGNKIIKIIQEVNARSGEKYLPPSLVKKPTSGQARVIDFLSTCLKALCKEFQIASRLILTTKDLNKIVVEGLMEPKRWVEAGLCSQQAVDLVGPFLIDVLKGKKGLAIQDEKLKFLDL